MHPHGTESFAPDCLSVLLNQGKKSDRETTRSSMDILDEKDLPGCILPEQTLHDRSIDRMHLESEAFMLNLGGLGTGKCTWISSGIIDHEVDQTPDSERSLRVLSCLFAGRSLSMKRLPA
jgi:hypothetical protein